MEKEVERLNVRQIWPSKFAWKQATDTEKGISLPFLGMVLFLWPQINPYILSYWLAEKLFWDNFPEIPENTKITDFSISEHCSDKGLKQALEISKWKLHAPLTQQPHC